MTHPPQPQYDPNQPPVVSGPPGPHYPAPQHDQAAIPSPTVSPQPRRRRGLIIGLAAAAVVLVIMVVGGIFLINRVASSGSSPGSGLSAWDLEQLGKDDFTAMQSRCDPGRTGTTVSDAGATLLIDGTGEEDFSGASVTVLECLVGELGMPEAVKQHMFDTRALDGRQEDSWPGYTASWSYHPDDGMDVIVRKA